MAIMQILETAKFHTRTHLILHIIQFSIFFSDLGLHICEDFSF
jgi:hypothetical protein